MDMYELRFDGLFRQVSYPNLDQSYAGIMSYGWLIVKNDLVIATGYGLFVRTRDATSNIAEYLALIEGLEALRDMGVCRESITVSGDAKCVLDQMRGSSSVHSESTKPFYNRAVRLSRWFNDLKWRWTPRRINRAADWLSRRALKQFYSDKASYSSILHEINHDRGRGSTKKLHPVIDIRIYHPIPPVTPGGVSTVTQLLNTWGNQIPRKAYTQ